MTIKISQSDPDDRALFQSQNWVHTKTADNKELITATGVILTNFKRKSGSSWRREKIEIRFRIPYHRPQGKELQVLQWAPFITINAIYNKGHSIDAGFAVDGFGGPGRKIAHGGYITIWANLAVNDSDAWLYRIAYSVTLSGRFVKFEIPPIE